MDFKLTEEQEAMREMAKNFAEKRIAPTMEEDEKEHRFRKRNCERKWQDWGFSDVLPRRSMAETKPVSLQPL